MIKLKGKGVKELKKLERELQTAIRSTNETIVKKEAELHRIKQDYSQARLRRRQLEYKESLRTPLFSEQLRLTWKKAENEYLEKEAAIRHL